MNVEPKGMLAQQLRVVLGTRAAYMNPPCEGKSLAWLPIWLVNCDSFQWALEEEASIANGGVLVASFMF